MPTYFLNLFRPNTARPTKPEPRSNSVAGSGTGEGPPSEVVSVDNFETRVDGEELGVNSSFEGQPTIPKNIIIIHKNTNI
jgi:hypothetical protein